MKEQIVFIALNTFPVGAVKKKQEGLESPEGKKEKKK